MEATGLPPHQGQKGLAAGLCAAQGKGHPHPSCIPTGTLQEPEAQGVSRASQQGRVWLGCEPRWAHRRLKTGVCPRPPSREGRGWDLNPDGLPSHKHPSCSLFSLQGSPQRQAVSQGAAPGHPAALCAYTVASRHHPRPGTTPDHRTSLEGRARQEKGRHRASSEGCRPEAMLSAGRGGPKAAPASFWLS